MITYETWGTLPSFSEDDGAKGALSVLRWAYEEYGENIVYACSFGIEGIVLIDLISKVKPDANIVFLDTNLHFRETYDVIAKIKERFPKLRIEMKRPALNLQEQEDAYGPKLWERNPNACCNIRKVQPLHEALSQGKAWISGLRREQSPTRKNTEFLNQDHKFHSIKVCPLIHWTWKDVWRHVYRENLPYNILHDQGYPSIGCEMCTLPAQGRDGRWSGTNKTECGLH
ncbi:phosphoadenylyl-sulfate reductase [Ectobacillus sp. JY-23]|uniref:phosphoadenylyl-sulfate reductase n=1 Tax=Ectobacillus sp. JY-23 TaxID=2933872 RepID=UPI001FF63CC0|nr:phosphoadenylyl-sulfate reductase [Ectobacillus sp. JY-23]UOY93241.1 phosphoadenylyl-sulfate reductase [Ectobacillus sp. JY-23]